MGGEMPEINPILEGEKILTDLKIPFQRGAGGNGCVKASATNRDLIFEAYYKLAKEAAEISKNYEKLQNTVKINEASQEENHGECPICLEPISNGLVILKCGHKFCAECFANHSRQDNKCGMCRTEFVDKRPRTALPDHEREWLVNQYRILKSNRLRAIVTDIKMASLERAKEILASAHEDAATTLSKAVSQWYQGAGPVEFSA